MQPGDLVKLRYSDDLREPWREYARLGALMRVRSIESWRRRGSVNIELAETTSKMFSNDWFRESDLEPWQKEETRPDLQARLKALRKAEKG